MDLNKLFLLWLEDHHTELTQKGSKLVFAYSKAIEKLRSFPHPITTPQHIKGIQYIGDKIFLLLCSRLKKHCLENGLEIPQAFENHISLNDHGGKRRDELDLDTGPSKKRRVNKWVPKRRSGSWAILVALFLANRGLAGLLKDAIVAAASQYCDHSFNANPAARDFYSAWDGIKTLLNRELVECIGRPKVYILTEAGCTMASLITDQEGIQRPNSDTPEDLPEQSFDNGIRYSPETSRIAQSPDASGNLFILRTSSPLRTIQDHTSGTLATTESIIQTECGTGEAEKSRGSFREVEKLYQSSHEPESRPDVVHAMEQPVHDRVNRVYAGTPYEIWPGESFDIVLLIDSREIRSQSERDFFYNRVVSNGVNCEVRSLSVGDVLWIARNKQLKKEVVLNYVCERKRLDDLAISIRDGRFAEQKARLKRSGLKNVYYLVEEAGLGDVQRIIDMKKLIETAISMVITTSNFFVQRFRRIDDTIDWLVTMTNIMIQRFRNRRLMVLKPKSVNTQDEYLDLLCTFRSKFERAPHKLSFEEPLEQEAHITNPKPAPKLSYECVHSFHMYQATLVKSNMMTVKEMFLLMLMLVRGISFEKAIMIQHKFKTPRKLIEFYREQAGSVTEKELLMLNVFSNAIGSKKINKAALVAMYEAWGI